jgi:16S rRNA (guanine966-N2)-methyltransferase
MLGPVQGNAVLDLFAGSGALGLEALSRGASSATFVDSDREAVRAIERNVAKLGLGGVRLVRSDAVRFISACSDRYDVVFVDPPYEMVESLRMSLTEQFPRVLAPGGTIVFETAADIEPELPLSVRVSRRYGSTRVTIFDGSERRS